MCFLFQFLHSKSRILLGRLAELRKKRSWKISKPTSISRKIYMEAYIQENRRVTPMLTSTMRLLTKNTANHQFGSWTLAHRNENMSRTAQNISWTPTWRLWTRGKQRKTFLWARSWIPAPSATLSYWKLKLFWKGTFKLFTPVPWKRNSASATLC